MPNAKAALVSIGLLCVRALGQQANVAGVALDSVTHLPLAGVHISLRPPAEDGAEQPVSAWGAISKRDGSFSIASVAAGTYDLFAQRNGYMQLVSVCVQGGSEATPGHSYLVLKAGQNAGDLRVEMTPEAFITGHVFDENGDPLEHFVVQAESVAGLRSYLIPARTDERGQFRLVLWPGKFYLKVSSMRLPADLAVEGNAPQTAYLMTWYPAADTRASAAIIQASPGQQTTDIDFHLTPARTLRISGTVSGTPEALKHAILFLGSNGSRGSFPIKPDGTFTLAGLPPRQYRLTAVSVGGPRRMQSQVADVMLKTADKTGVVLALVPGETVSGVVEIAGGSMKSAGLEKLSVEFLRFNDVYGGDRLKNTVDSDGRFRIDDVFPGSFRIGVAPLPENAHLKSLKVDSSEVSDGVIDFSRGVNRANLRITISLSGATLEGRVVTKDGKPDPNHRLVFLGTAADGSDSDHWESSAPDGSFRFTGLRPGKYRLIAIDPRLAPTRNEMLKPLFDAAPEFEIHERDRIRRNAETALPQPDNAKP